MKKHATQAAKPTEEVFSAGLVVILLLVLPQLGSVAMTIGSAIGFAAYVYLFPDRFRTRSGSLKLAIGLASFLAILAGIVVVMSLAGQLE